MSRFTFIVLVMLLAGTGIVAAAPSTQTGSNLDDATFIINCDTGEQIIGGVKFTFVNVNPGFQYRVSAIGIDGFDPVLAVVTAPGIGACNDDLRALRGSQVAVPGIGLVEATETAAQVEINTGRGGNIDVVIGGFAGDYGQFAMVVEGLAVNPADDLDAFLVSVPQATANLPLGMYMISRDGSGVDPYMYVWAGPGLQGDQFDESNIELVFECDDAGSGDCSDTPSFPGGGVIIMNGYRYEAGNQDAGISLIPESTDKILVGFGSYEMQSTGEYGIIVVGTAPGNLDSEPVGTTEGEDTGECFDVAESILSASSEYSTDYAAANLLDGNPATGWSSDGSSADENYVIIGLNGMQTVSGIRFNAYSSSAGYENDSIKDFTIFKYDENEEVEIIYTGTASLTSGYQSFYFDPVTTDHLGVFFLSNYGGSYYEATDIAVCGEF